MRQNKLFRMTPGQEPELVRDTIGGNGTTFDLQGRLDRVRGRRPRASRAWAPTARSRSLADRYKGGRFNRPNDVVCHSDGSLYFTDPDKRVPYHEREMPGPEGDDNLWDGAGVYRLAPDGELEHVALCEYPNGLAFSPDERTLYVANTRSSKYIHAIELDAAGKHDRAQHLRRHERGRRARHPRRPEGRQPSAASTAPGPGGIWVFTPDGKRIGIIDLPEQAVNFAFGGAGPADAVLLRAHLGLHAAREGAGPAASLVQGKGGVRAGKVSQPGDENPLGAMSDISHARMGAQPHWLPWRARSRCVRRLTHVTARLKRGLARPAVQRGLEIARRASPRVPRRTQDIKVSRPTDAAPGGGVEELHFLRHHEGPELGGEHLDEVLVGEHGGPVLVAVGVVLELPQVHELVDHAGVALEVADEVLVVPAFL